MKYAIINMPAIFWMTHSPSSGLYSVYCEGEMIGQSFSKDECEYIAKQYYKKSS